MSESKAKVKARPGGCIYRVFTPLCIRASGQWIRPTGNESSVVANLSDVPDEMIQWLLKNGGIETADGEPINKPTGKRASDKPCPCNK